MLPMLPALQDLAFRRSIAFEFIGDDYAWDVLESYAELPKKSFRCLFVPSALYKDIEHVAILIYGPPERVRFSVDAHGTRASCVPFVTTARATTSQLVGVRLPKCEAPLTHRFRGDDDSALCVVRSSTVPRN
jgi:hypothetical protein